MSPSIGMVHLLSLSDQSDVDTSQDLRKLLGWQIWMERSTKSVPTLQLNGIEIASRELETADLNLGLSDLSWP